MQHYVAAVVVLVVVVVVVVAIELVSIVIYQATYLSISLAFSIC